MAIAAMAGIPIFATGGIGGVHRGAEETFDVSADLTELARSPVAVVSAGCKSILDIAKTLEVLETLGVPVVGYRTDEFPAFFARSSGQRLDHRFETPRELAELIGVARRLGARTGILIANPIPEEHALPAAEIEARIEAAAREARAAGIAQKDVTPLSARAHQRADRRQEPDGEYRAGEEQRRAGGEGRRRARLAPRRRLIRCRPSSSSAT